SNGQPPPSPAVDETDPFNVASLRLDDEDLSAVGVEEIVTTIPYKKPPKDTFFRVCPDPNYSVRIGVIELDGRGECYYVARPLWPLLIEEATFGYRQLYTCCTAGGEIFLWGCRLPGADGKQPVWVTVPLEAVKQAKTQWVRLFWDNDQRKHR